MSRWTSAASKLGYTVYHFGEPDRRSPGSSHNKSTKEIWLDPDAYDLGVSLKGFIISLAHELGHIRDDPTDADQKLVKGTVEHATRTLEREETAWSLARQRLSEERCWSVLKEALDHREEVSLVAYEACLEKIRGDAKYEAPTGNK